MVKGAVLIGCGFTPTSIDAQNAVRDGHIKNCKTITRLGFSPPVRIELALTAYIQIAQKKGWDTPAGLEAKQFSAAGGEHQMWSVYPVN